MKSPVSRRGTIAFRPELEAAEVTPRVAERERELQIGADLPPLEQAEGRLEGDPEKALTTHPGPVPLAFTGNGHVAVELEPRLQRPVDVAFVDLNLEGIHGVRRASPGRDRQQRQEVAGSHRATIPPTRPARPRRKGADLAEGRCPRHDVRNGDVRKKMRG